MRAKVRSILKGRKLLARDRLVLAHLDLVESIATKLHASLPACFDLGDLIQSGMLGLLEAAGQYDPSNHPGVAFGAFARRRIKGEIQDSIGLHSAGGGKYDQANGVTRTTRQNKWNEATRPPIAECKAADENLNNAAPRETRDLHARADAMLERTEQREMLNDLIETLPRRQAVVIELHYGEDLELKRIAYTRGLNVGPARVSQLHTAALASMRDQARLRFGKKAA